MADRTPRAEHLGEQEVERLSSSIRGRVVKPADPSYDSARAIYNGMIDRHPALIVRCAGPADVAEAVRFARGRGMLVSVRGGGHNVAGNALCDDGLVVDLSPMKGVWVDPARRIARAQGGVTWGDIDRETQAFGLAVTGGIATTTGIAGLTLGGGMGWLVRRHGLTIDNLRSADLVLADGTFVTASATEHPDLFWAIRGGGGNFGVVTSFEYDLHPVGPTVYAGTVVYRADGAEDVLRRYRDYVANAPDDLMTITSLRLAPAVPYLPPEVHGTPTVGFLACCVGPLDRATRLAEPLRRLGAPVGDTLGPKPYVEHQAVTDPLFPHGLRNYWKATNLPDLSDQAIDTLLDQFSTMPSRRTGITMWQLGGAASRIDPASTAYSHRDARYAVNIPSLWERPDDDEANVRWTRECCDAMSAYSSGAVYVNFLGQEGEERVRAAYNPDTFDRLGRIKAEYDPTNFFRINQNISPRASERTG